MIILNSTLDYSLYDLNSPYSLPLYDPLQFVAPYWADVDIIGTGDIYYRQTTDPSLLARATSEIRAAFPEYEHNVMTNLFITTWHAVGYYNRNADKVCIMCIQTVVVDYILINIVDIVYYTII